MDDDMRAIEASARRFNDTTSVDSQFSMDESRVGPRGATRNQRPRAGMNNHPGFYEVGYNPHGQPREPDFSNVKVEHLSPEEKERLLVELLQGHNDHTKTRRDLQVEDERMNLDNKRKFSTLGYGFVKWSGIGLACCIAVILGITVFAVVADRQIVDTGIISNFLKTFTEIIKLIFSSF